MQELERDPAFKLDDIHDLSKDQVRERTMRKFHGEYPCKRVTSGQKSNNSTTAMVHYVT